MNETILDSIQTEHAEFRGELERAMNTGGETGEAARSVMERLSPHLLLETELAITPLALLPRLVRGEFHPGMKAFLPRIDALRSELPRLLEDHEGIVLALQQLLRAATRERHVGYADFARRLIHHAQMEEEILYPAAILVGDYIRLLADRPARTAEVTAEYEGLSMTDSLSRQGMP